MQIKSYSILFMLILSACDNKEKIERPDTIVIETVEVVKPAPIVSKPDQVNMLPVEWHVITRDTAEAKLSKYNVLFALDENGYKNLAKNNGAIRAFTEQQKSVISVYEQHHRKPK